MIVGIDPGTTVGWAAIDWDGKLIAKGSQREFDRDALVKRLVDLGSVILVGTDKAKIPSFVQEVATSVGALVLNPKEDLKVDEKREATKQFKGNAHELDALAAAIFAFKRKEVLIRKIRSTLERVKKPELFEDVVDLVLRERVSIKTALDAFEKGEDDVIFDARDEKPIDLVRMIEALAKARGEARTLAKRNRESEQSIELMQKEITALRQRMIGLVKPKTSEQIAKLSHAQVTSLEHRFAHAQSQTKLLEERKRVFEQAMLSEKFTAVPRLKSLGKQSVGFNASVIFVDDAAKASDRTLGHLKERGVELVICKKLPERRLPFAVVQLNEVIEGDSLVLIKKSWLEEKRTAKEVLNKVVEEYQKTRS